MSRSVRSCRILCAVALLAGLYRAPASAAPSPSGPPPVVQWTPGMSASVLRAAPVVRISRGFRDADLAQLRPGQLVETPSGKRVNVALLRAIKSAFATGRAKNAAHPEGKFAVVQGSAKTCAPLPPGESAETTLARPPGMIVCSAAGKPVSVAQLRAMAPFVRTRYRSVAAAAPSADGHVIRVTSRAQLDAQLKAAPDSAIIVTPQGNRTTVGALRLYMQSRTPAARAK